jgi:flagellar motor switch protein FliG
MALTGPEKAVLMLLSLDEATAGPIVAELDGNELRKLREVAAMMRAVPAMSLDEVYGEFVERGAELVAVPHGGVSYLRRLASSALGETRSQEIFVDAPRSGLERIAHASPGSLAPILENEHPQMVAAILSQIDASRAARILEGLPPEMQLNVIERLSTMTEVPAGLLETVASALSEELPPSEAEAAVSVDGVSRSAALIRKLGKESAADLLGRMTDANAEIATVIRQAMFTFEDLKGVDPRAMRALLKEVATDKLVLALKTASEALRNHIFSSMSARAASLIREDLEALGSVRLAEVEAAQRTIVDAALALDASGTISLWSEGDDMV